MENQKDKKTKILVVENVAFVGSPPPYQKLNNDGSKQGP